VGGVSVEETSRNLDDAVTLYLTALIERGIPLPIGCEAEIVQEQVVEHSVPFDGFGDEDAVPARKELDLAIPLPA